jgi:DNA-binding GntR family transcriptional regulator
MQSKPSLPLDDFLASAMEDRIIAGELKSGQRLRQEAIAQEFGVSPIPVRAAFRKLATRGFVDIHPRRGASVTHFRASEIVDFLDVRIILETAALRFAIPRMTAADLTSAKAAIEDAECNRNAAHWPELNWRFHLAIYSPCGRPVLIEQIARLHESARSRRLHRMITQDIDASNKEHRRLLLHIEKGEGDSDTAAAFLSRHIGISTPQLKKLISTLEY